MSEKYTLVSGCHGMNNDCINHRICLAEIDSSRILTEIKKPWNGYVRGPDIYYDFSDAEVEAVTFREIILKDRKGKYWKISAVTVQSGSCVDGMDYTDRNPYLIIFEINKYETGKYMENYIKETEWIKAAGIEVNAKSLVDLERYMLGLPASEAVGKNFLDMARDYGRMVAAGGEQ